MAVGDKKKSVMQFDIDTASLSNDATHVPSSPLVKSALDAIYQASGAGNLKLSDGTLIQWGKVTGIAFSSEAIKTGDVPFPIPYLSGTQVVAVATPDQTGVADYVFRLGVTASAATLSWTLTTKDGEAISASNRSFNWLAIGRWKA